MCGKKSKLGKSSFIAHFLFCLVITGNLHAQIETFELNSNWKFRQSADSIEWLPATVPGCVHTDLLSAGKIPDPFYGTNEQLVTWVDSMNWIYQCLFIVDNKLLRQEHIELVCEGLDTYASIYINGKFVQATEDMFVEYRFDVKPLLKKGENEITIEFESPLLRAGLLKQNSPVFYPPDERVWSRKAQYQFGWDWGPRFVTSGIWKPIYIESWDRGRINSVFVNTVYANPDSARYFVEYNYELDKERTIRLQLKNLNTGEVIKTKYKSESNYRGRIYQNEKNPELWWCNGLGQAHLRNYELKISSGMKTIDKQSFKAGIRSIEHIRDSSGAFYFRINEQPVFVKGANIIPLNSFPSSSTPTDYRKLLSEAQHMHMNMLRVWGGGIYENDVFYSLCDSLGIMVWQDFMYACAMYPLHELNYRNTIVNETVYQIRRLRPHPSIALWCGNNEIDEGWNNWGWQDAGDYSEEELFYIERNYADWFELNFEAELDMNYGWNKNYIPTSPTTGWGHPESLTQGDCHYWGVWWGNEPFEVYSQKIPRFMSEYGFQAMPSVFSLHNYIPQRDLEGTAQDVLSTSSMRNHQKHPAGYQIINAYMQRSYRVPEKMDDYIYVSQLLQAQGMRIAIEAQRRSMPWCMGTLFWQLNDCWPVTSWSVIDYYGNRKASYYTAKEKYEPLMLSIEQKNDSLFIWAVNDLESSLSTSVEYRFMKTDGTGLVKFTHMKLVPSHSSVCIDTLEMRSYLRHTNPAEVVLFADAVTFLSGGFTRFGTVHEFVLPKDLILYPPEIDFRYNQADSSIEIISPVYVKQLYLYLDDGELFLDRNFISLDHASVIVKVEGSWPDRIETRLRYKCLNTIYSD